MKSLERRILIVLTNHATYPTKKDTTGLWLGELVHFYDLFEKEGFSMDLVSPKGGYVPLDHLSLSFWFLDDDSNARLNDPEFRKRLENTLSPDQVEWKGYDCIYFAGGHGTMWDFPDQTQLQEISRNIYESGGVVSAVCHGVSGLLNVRLSDETYLVSGKEVTGYSNMEERLARRSDQVPFFLEDELKQHGGMYKKGLIPLISYALVDGRLVTGQNPNSTKAVAQETLKVIRENLR